jgi:light-regulated signal transduction histidine kinase (bacteriophytochrome)
MPSAGADTVSPSWWTITRTMLAALTAVVASFVLAIVYGEHRAATIDAMATSIVENAAPSIEHLAAARAELRQLQALTADYVNDAVLGRPVDRRRIDEVRAELSRQIDAYLGDAEVRRVVVRVRDSGERVCFDVEDTGPGVAPELQDIIFEPYARVPGSTAPGLGLGRATVKRLVEAHGGDVWCRSTPGQGSTFSIALPKAARAEGACVLSTPCPLPEKRV